MRKNVGCIDKNIRLIVAAALVVLMFTKVVRGTLAIILGIAAVLLIVTSIISWCGLYAVLGISTKKQAGTPEDQGDKGCGCGSH